MASLLMTDDHRLMPGLRFHPTDVEIIVDYLKPRVSSPNFKVPQFLIKEFDVFSMEPWRLPGDSFQYQSEQKDMYFFTPRHPTSKGSRRASRMAGIGFWLGNGRDHHIEIKTKVSGKVTTKVIGHRTQLTFMISKGTGFQKTDWIMHEFRLPCRDATKFDDLVLCRIHKKMTKRGSKEMSDRYIGEEEEGEVVEGRLAKRRRTEEELVPILHKPEEQQVDDEKELERLMELENVILELLNEPDLMEANGWTTPCGAVEVQEQEAAADTMTGPEMGQQVLGYRQGLMGDSSVAESSGVDNTMSTNPTWTLPYGFVDIQEQEAAADTMAGLEMGSQVTGYQQMLVGDSNEAENSEVDNTVSANPTGMPVCGFVSIQEEEAAATDTITELERGRQVLECQQGSVCDSDEAESPGVDSTVSTDPTWTPPCGIVDIQEQEAAAETMTGPEMGCQVVGHRQGLVGESNEAKSSGVENILSTSQPCSVNDDFPPLEDLFCLDDFPELNGDCSRSCPNVESIPSRADFY